MYIKLKSLVEIIQQGCIELKVSVWLNSEKVYAEGIVIYMQSNIVWAGADMTNDFPFHMGSGHVDPDEWGRRRE